MLQILIELPLIQSIIVHSSFGLARKSVRRCELNKGKESYRFELVSYRSTKYFFLFLVVHRTQNHYAF